MSYEPPDLTVLFTGSLTTSGSANTTTTHPMLSAPGASKRYRIWWVYTSFSRNHSLSTADFVADIIYTGIGSFILTGDLPLLNLTFPGGVALPANGAFSISTIPNAQTVGLSGIRGGVGYTVELV